MSSIPDEVIFKLREDANQIYNEILAKNESVEAAQRQQFESMAEEIQKISEEFLNHLYGACIYKIVVVDQKTDLWNVLDTIKIEERPVAIFLENKPDFWVIFGAFQKDDNEVIVLYKDSVKNEIPKDFEVNIKKWTKLNTTFHYNIMDDQNGIGFPNSTLCINNFMTIVSEIDTDMEKFVKNFSTFKFRDTE